MPNDHWIVSATAASNDGHTGCEKSPAVKKSLTVATTDHLDGLSANRTSAGDHQRWESSSTIDFRPLTALFNLLSRGYVVEEDKLQEQMVAGELLRQGREGNGSVDACKSRTVERVGA